MSLVKICGLKRHEDIEYVNRYKPDYIGFVFAESRRRVSLSEAAQLSAGLDKDIKKAGVFVNAGLEEIAAAVEACSLDAVQIHGEEAPDFLVKIKERTGYQTQVWKSIRVIDKSSLDLLYSYDADAYLLDTFVKGSYGGSGQIFDWDIAAKAASDKRIVLAGGLNSENVKRAIKAVKPYIVDVSSGVETEGFKDEIKIRNFIEIARAI
ncbi:MAG: phosphoribosylanthranilate isomerase [Bacillota bacterium]|nr:phosphoribosylanthranilate isomerase [Bacillota bacterium]